jgi:hypothetical protein
VLPENGVGVKELSRLISRLRHRQFGILVTTCFLVHQTYLELRSDRHPVVVIAGADIAQTLVRAGLGTLDAVRKRLSASFRLKHGGLGREALHWRRGQRFGPEKYKFRVRHVPLSVSDDGMGHFDNGAILQPSGRLPSAETTAGRVGQ